MNDKLRPQKPKKGDLTAKSAVENEAANMMFVQNTRTKERGLVFASFVGQRGTLDSEL